MSAKPLGFYGLKVEPATEEAIDKARMGVLIDLFEDFANGICDRHYYNTNEPQVETGEMLSPLIPELSELQHIGMIRALCDRIEAKLHAAPKKIVVIINE
jgi:hypothetical protein